MLAKQKGVFCVFLAAVLYSIGGLCIKLLPWNGLSINGGRTGIALLVFAAYILATGHKVRFNKWVLLGALCVCGTNTLYTTANKLTTAANTIVLQFTAPIFVLIFTILIFRKKPKRLDVIACIIVFVGILFFFADALSGGGMLGNILALISGVTYAGVFMLNDMPDGDSISSVFFGAMLSVSTGLPFLLQETSFPPSAIVSIIILGLFQTGAAYVLLCIGLKTTQPVTASLVSGIEPILSPVLVALFYGEEIGVFALVGGTIVIAAVIGYNVILAKQEQTTGKPDVIKQEYKEITK